MQRFQKIRSICLAFALCTLFVGQTSALTYTVDAPDGPLYGHPTSDSAVYEMETLNVDRSKNVALIPPAFGSATSYLPGSGTYLTPNLVPGALSGGLTAQTGSVTYPTVDVGGAVSSFTPVTDELYYSGGYLGTLKIPSIGVNVKIYEGTDSIQLAKGAGHFEETSIWSGNVALAGHNRGVNEIFGQIHTLQPRTRITLTTRLGTRTYEVVSVSKVSETDRSGLAPSANNMLTLYTCVRDQKEYRWCVVAQEIR